MQVSFYCVSNLYSIHPLNQRPNLITKITDYKEQLQCYVHAFFLAQCVKERDRRKKYKRQLQKVQWQNRSWIAIEVIATLSVAAQLCCLAVLFVEQEDSGQLLENGTEVTTAFQVQLDVLMKEVSSGIESVTQEVPSVCGGGFFFFFSGFWDFLTLRLELALFTLVLLHTFSEG